MITSISYPRTMNRRDLIEHIGETAHEQGVALISGFVSENTARDIRRQVRNLLIPGIPMRAVRYGAEKVLGRVATPPFLQRRPQTLARRHAGRFFTEGVVSVLKDIDVFNHELLRQQHLKTRYGDTVHEISKMILNRFSPWEEFEAHQDSISETGLSFIVQTSPTLWRVHPFGPRMGMEPLEFQTDAGDLVVMTQSSASTPKVSERYAGFTDFDPEGSVIHSGENLTNKNRFSLALFSSPLHIQ